MGLYILALFSWFLTILAPCVLPLLPLILGNALQGWKYRIIAILGSFGLSTFLFTILIKMSTVAIGLDQATLLLIGGVIISLVWLAMIFEKQRQMFLHMCTKWRKGIARAKWVKSEWLGSSILLGASLWPLFNSCSPTYGLILWAVLPVSLYTAIIALLIYILGLLIGLTLIILWGRLLIRRIWTVIWSRTWKLTIGIITLLIGIAIIFGWDKKFESYLIEHWIFIDLSSFEYQVIDDLSLWE